MSAALRLDRMSPREQRLLSVLGVVVAGLVLLGAPAYVYGKVTSAREHNHEIAEQLDGMTRASALLAKRRAAREARELLYSTPAPALASFIEGAMRAQGIEVPESADQPDAVGKVFTERSTQVKLRKVGLKPLVNALEQLERSKSAVAVTRLKITARSAPDEYDVALTVSAYDKKKSDGGGKDGEGKDGEGDDADKKGDAPGKTAPTTAKGQPL